MLRRITLSLLAATAIGVVTYQGASAADMGIPRKAPPVAPPVPLFNWTGFYAGGFFGAGLSRTKVSPASSSLPSITEGALFGSTNTFPVTDSVCEGCSFGSQGGSHTGLGPQGGITAGWRYQAVGSPLVWGIEGQFAWADIQGSHTSALSSVFEGVCEGGSNLCLENINHQALISSQIKDIAIIAGTFGMTSGPEDRTLWFVKAGGAWNRTGFSAVDNVSVQSQTLFGLSFTQGLNSSAFSSANSNRWGWMVGTGVEWGLWGNWSARIEYEFLDFGDFDVHLNGNANTTLVHSTCCGTTSFSTAFGQTLHVNQQIHLVQVGLNYKFDWGNWGHY